jgi:hypothetical protein
MDLRERREIIRVQIIAKGVGRETRGPQKMGMQKNEERLHQEGQVKVRLSPEEETSIDVVGGIGGR